MTDHPECSACNSQGLPGGLLLYMLTSIDYPVAVVQSDHRFKWCNAAYERLVGYSLTELQARTWMDITVGDDVAGDLQSVKAILENKSDTYSLYKRYRHRSGEEVPVNLTVRRYPPSGEMAFFLAEAPKVQATKKELDACHTELTQRMAALAKRMDAMSQENKQRNEHHDSHIFNVGSHANDVSMFRWIVVAIAILIGAVSYLIYIGGWAHHQGGAQPPPTVIPD